MARVTTETTEMQVTTGKCHTCEGQSHVYWFGRQTIELCSSCAELICPALIADTTSSHFEGSAEHTADRMLARFWKCIAKSRWGENRRLREQLKKPSEGLTSEDETFMADGGGPLSESDAL